MIKDFLFLFSNRQGFIDEKILKQINQFIKDNSAWHIEYLITEHENHLTEKIFSFVADYPKSLIIVGGGDGSYNEAVNAIVNTGTDAALCPIPFGTANDFCKILYKKYNFSRFLSDLKQLKLGKIDLLKLSGKLHFLGNGPDNVNDVHTQYIDTCYVLNVASFGFDSKIVQSAFRYIAKYPKVKGSAYYLAVLKHFFKKHLETYPIEFDIDGKTFQAEILLAALCNGAYYGNGFNPAPDFDLFDGKLNYLIAPKISHLKFAHIALKYKSGKILQEKQIQHGTAKKIRIRTIHHIPVLANYDGILFESNDFEVSIVEKALSLAFVGDFAQRLL